MNGCFRRRYSTLFREGINKYFRQDAENWPSPIPSKSLLFRRRGVVMSFDLSLYHAKQDESTSKEGSRHQHIRRKVRRKAETVERKSRAVRGGNCGLGRSQGNYSVRVGVRITLTPHFRPSSTRRHLWIQENSGHFTRKIKYFCKMQKTPLDKFYAFRKIVSVASLVHGHLTIRHTWRPVSGGTTQH